PCLRTGPPLRARGSERSAAERGGHRQVLARFDVAIEIVVRVRSPVALAVLFTPELLAAGRLPGLDAARTRGLDVWDARLGRLIAGALDQHRTRREPHHGPGHRSDEQTPEPTAAVRPDDDQIRLHVGGELRDALCRLIHPKV